MTEYDKAKSFIEVRRTGPLEESIRARVGALLLGWEQSAAVSASALEAARALVAGTTLTGLPFPAQPQIVDELALVADADLPRYLAYRYRYEVFPEEKRVDDFPPCVQIEPTSYCNYRCVFCYQTDPEFTSRQNGHMGHMSLELFRQIVDQSVGRTEAVTLASRGEPLMCRDIDAMLAYAAGKFLAFKINTNASLLDEKRSHALLAAEPGTIVFSADAAKEPLYSQLRVNGKLDRVLANVRRFREIQRTHYPKSKTITRVSGVKVSSDQSMAEMEAVWGELVDQVAFVNYNPWENAYTSPETGIERPCSDLWRRTFVWWDGTVNPCDVDFKSHLAVGKIGEHELSSLWTGPQYSQYREAHLARRRNSMSPCNRCSVV